MTRPKLLLADDSVTIRKVVELTFADEGVDVTTVADGERAMSKFVEIHPDIVLVDVGLPGTDGYHICEMIKSDESTSHIPVLLLVGSFEPFDQDAAEESGADGFLTKPFHSIRDLVNRVHELLGTQQQMGIDNVVDFDTTMTDTAHDNEDIDDLYERSFAETVPIDDHETAASLGSLQTFPDEVIAEEEASRSTEPEPEQAEPRVEEVQHSTDEWLDDEMIETISSADPDEIQAAEGVAINAVAEYDEAPAAAVDIEPIKEFDWSPAALITSADEKEIGAAAGFMGYTQEEPFFPQIPEPEAHITEKLPDIRTDEIRDVSHEQADGAFQAAEEPLEETSPQPDEQTSEAPKAITELSPELVEDIVQRVLERLSDRAVREVAQEAVPRIAERLMREALEEDRSRIP